MNGFVDEVVSLPDTDLASAVSTAVAVISDPYYPIDEVINEVPPSLIASMMADADLEPLDAILPSTESSSSLSSAAVAVNANAIVPSHCTQSKKLKTCKMSRKINTATEFDMEVDDDDDEDDEDVDAGGDDDDDDEEEVESVGGGSCGNSNSSNCSGGNGGPRYPSIGRISIGKRIHADGTPKRPNDEESETTDSEYENHHRHRRGGGVERNRNGARRRRYSDASLPRKGSKLNRKPTSTRIVSNSESSDSDSDNAMRDDSKKRQRATLSIIKRGGKRSHTQHYEGEFNLVRSKSPSQQVVNSNSKVVLNNNCYDATAAGSSVNTDEFVDNRSTSDVGVVECAQTIEMSRKQHPHQQQPQQPHHVEYNSNVVGGKMLRSKRMIPPPQLQASPVTVSSLNSQDDVTEAANVLVAIMKEQDANTATGAATDNETEAIVEDMELDDVNGTDAIIMENVTAAGTISIAASENVVDYVATSVNANATAATAAAAAVTAAVSTFHVNDVFDVSPIDATAAVAIVDNVVDSNVRGGNGDGNNDAAAATTTVANNGVAFAVDGSDNNACGGDVNGADGGVGGGVGDGRSVTCESVKPVKMTRKRKQASSNNGNAKKVKSNTVAKTGSGGAAAAAAAANTKSKENGVKVSRKMNTVVVDAPSVVLRSKSANIDDAVTVNAVSNNNSNKNNNFDDTIKLDAVAIVTNDDATKTGDGRRAMCISTISATTPTTMASNASHHHHNTIITTTTTTTTTTAAAAATAAAVAASATTNYDDDDNAINGRGSKPLVVDFDNDVDDEDLPFVNVNNLSPPRNAGIVAPNKVLNTVAAITADFDDASSSDTTTTTTATTTITIPNDSTAAAAINVAPNVDNVDDCGVGVGVGVGGGGGGVGSVTVDGGINGGSSIGVVVVGSVSNGNDKNSNTHNNNNNNNNINVGGKDDTVAVNGETNEASEGGKVTRRQKSRGKSVTKPNKVASKLKEIDGKKTRTQTKTKSQTLKHKQAQPQPPPQTLRSQTRPPPPQHTQHPINLNNKEFYKKKRAAQESTQALHRRTAAAAPAASSSSSSSSLAKKSKKVQFEIVDRRTGFTKERYQTIYKGTDFANKFDPIERRKKETPREDDYDDDEDDDATVESNKQKIHYTDTDGSDSSDSDSGNSSSSGGSDDSEDDEDEDSDNEVDDGDSDSSDDENVDAVIQKHSPVKLSKSKQKRGAVASTFNAATVATATTTTATSAAAVSSKRTVQTKATTQPKPTTQTKPNVAATTTATKNAAASTTSTTSTSTGTTNINANTTVIDSTPRKQPVATKKPKQMFVNKRFNEQHAKTVATKRHKKVKPHDKDFIRRSMVRKYIKGLGITRVAKQVYVELERILKFFLKEVKTRSVYVVEHKKRMTVSLEDIKFALHTIGMRVCAGDADYDVNQPSDSKTYTEIGCKSSKNNTVERMVVDLKNRKLFLSTLPFCRLWKNIRVESMIHTLRYSGSAILMIRDVAEIYLARVIESACLVTLSAKRKTVMAEDLKYMIHIKMLDTVNIYLHMYNELYPSQPDNDTPQPQTHSHQQQTHHHNHHKNVQSKKQLKL